MSKIFFENFLKIVILNILLFIALKIHKPQFYFFYILFNFFALLIFVMIDSKVEDDESIYFYSAEKFENSLKKKKKYYSFFERLKIFLFNPSKTVIYIYFLMFAIFFFMFNEEMADIISITVGTIISWVMEPFK